MPIPVSQWKASALEAKRRWRAMSCLSCQCRLERSGPADGGAGICVLNSLLLDVAKVNRKGDDTLVEYGIQMTKPHC